ncbi:BZ3500_MvSof-1268-A1-R1_Chr1-2g01440 [Microbotryum saponariae]|uniref:BZ3500_MvSof-1268-A1-R1_Chr1-2g01440 protein n=1 Tax=Microbotryum saponariae TaxID=289078 RepID=A0A2X0KU46_9BASI|nr:BZ3500_MvSof-1268-A1-R1_Chr1-2g01440 [Microbotryum saponariae]SCZ97442.1 BZ3501_MvSof-1269-A2-R1_Chr1-2g01039 [Microbotryum saponariae]
MRIAVSSSLWGLALLPCLGYALPASTSGAGRLIKSNTSIPTPIIAPELQGHHKLKGVYVHLIGVSEGGAADQRSTFFGNANDQIALVCEQLTQTPQLVDPQLNPSGKVDAIGFSQGGQLLRGLVERCSELNFRSLITLGSQHMGISSLPPCPPGSSPFSTCHLFRLSLLKNGLYSSWAQQNLLPAQYVRDEARIEDYLKVNVFLKDINNEREGDRKVGPPKDGEVVGVRVRDQGEGRNQTYKRNFARLEKLVLLRFSMDTTVVPPHTAHFTLPSPTASPCPFSLDPTCYVDPVEWADLPLYQDDYIGLKELDARGVVWKGVCKGAHMEIDRRCWSTVTRFLVGNGEKEGGEDVRENAFVLQG